MLRYEDLELDEALSYEEQLVAYFRNFDSQRHIFIIGYMS